MGKSCEWLTKNCSEMRCCCVAYFLASKANDKGDDDDDDDAMLFRVYISFTYTRSFL